MDSITPGSLFSQTQTINSKFLHEHKSLGLRVSKLHHKQMQITFQPLKFCTSINTSRPGSNFRCSNIPYFQSSNSLSTSNFTSTHNVFFIFLSEKIVFFLLGSFIFMGWFNKRAALALPPIDFSKTLEENSVNGKSEEEEMYEKLLERDPRNVEALKVVLFAKIRRGKSKEAVKYVESLINVEPNEVEWRLLLALCYETMGHLSKAKRLFREILEQRPLLVRALHGLAMAMHKNYEGPAVFEMLNKSLELAQREQRVTEERNIKILIAQMHLVKGDLEESLKRFQELIDEDPRDFRPYLCQGIIYSLMDKKEEAAKQFETYQSLVPEEFPQRGFLDDVVFTAKETSREQFHKEFQSHYSHRKDRHSVADEKS